MPARSAQDGQEPGSGRCGRGGRTGAEPFGTTGVADAGRERRNQEPGASVGDLEPQEFARIPDRHSGRRRRPHRPTRRAGKPGARFSAFGFCSLARRSREDEELAVAIWIRSDVPRRHLLKLFADVSSAVKERLCSEDPTKGKSVEETIARPVDRLQAQTRQLSPQFASAPALVRLLEQAGRLDEDALRAFANAKQFSETVLSFASIS